MNEPADNKIVVIWQKTRLEGLIERFGTRDQAKFYIEHSSLDFSDYQTEHDAYHTSLATLKERLAALPYRTQFVGKEFLPNFIFGKNDIVVVIGQDGLVANAAKYVDGHAIVAINPDPKRFDGILLPFLPEEAESAVIGLLKETLPIRTITMAEARLNNGQKLLAFNDFFIGAKSHVSARYAIHYHNAKEAHSSSGILVSTGAGSTGWLSSTLTMARGVMHAFATNSSPWENPNSGPAITLGWEEKKLAFVVREPFVSIATSARIAGGFIGQEETLLIESRMPENGIIFSDGIESDYLEFNAGVIATIGIANRSARLVSKNSY